MDGTPADYHRAQVNLPGTCASITILATAHSQLRQYIGQNLGNIAFSLNVATSASIQNLCRRLSTSLTMYVYHADVSHRQVTSLELLSTVELRVTRNIELGVRQRPELLHPL